MKDTSRDQNGNDTCDEGKVYIDIERRSVVNKRRFVLVFFGCF